MTDKTESFSHDPTLTQTEKRISIGIVRITPPILKRGQIWFEKNKKSILREAHNPTSWWSANYFEIEIDQVIPMSQLMRRLADWDYKKVQTVRSPGQFSNRGGLLDIFPINDKNASRIEYDGNNISSINALDDVAIQDSEKNLESILQAIEISKKYNQGKDTSREHENMLATLKKDTYVVHIDHGIAQYRGSEEKTNGTYLLLEYAKGDMLYVPQKLQGRLTPYVGFSNPILTRLGGNVWEKTKRKVKEDLIETARELARIYAKRELAKREPYKIDDSLYSIVADAFEYQETEDQIKAINSVRKDLESSRPADRIICGDVGFGKTEVALRGAAYAVSAGYQVAIIAPTTILAHQHYRTFTERFKASPYPIHIRKLTRMETRPEQKTILEDLQRKKCDIVIGTHRVLQKDVEFANLGLLVIDEEQRFGVKQKEFFKNKRAQLDILSLSATPIPRTLSFALSGLRDIDIISTPPPGRKPIQTIVGRMNKALIQRAIEKELKREGQVYYLHNKILSLAKTVTMLKKLLPEARIDFLHAKLPEQEIIKKIDDFREEKIDILVSTTIMENGLDLANANTLIVDDATRLGLAQSHQIRGRVGRGDLQAYAYFLYPMRKLAEKSKARLKALEESQYLGAGYQIALRDLEIRGGGSFLGKEQSGSIARVGFNLYCQLLNEAIDEIKNSPKKKNE